MIETDFDQKRELAQHFIQCYLAARQGLTKLGILRSERTLQGDCAEWLVAELLRLRLAPSRIQKGFDATDRKGQTYQIKSRIVKSLDQSTSFNFADIAASFDYLVPRVQRVTRPSANSRIDDSDEIAIHLSAYV